MGTGKSTVGRRVADSLGYTFVDTDDAIEQQAGKPISDIFATEGEAYFRALETTVLTECCHSQEPCVLSTGGGIVVTEANHAILAAGGQVIWLRASPDVIYERVHRNHDRPLLETKDPKKTIRDLLATREDLYASCADFKIWTDELSLEETIYGITETARFWQSDGQLG